MKIEKTQNKIVCDLGACKNRGEFVLSFDGLSRYSDLHICKECAREICTRFRYALRKKHENRE